MKITVIGTGYVGLPSGAGFAELGHDVICVDNDLAKVALLRSGQVTLYEAGLEELMMRNVASGRLRFSSSMADSVPQADVVIIAVGTPPHPITKEADMKYIRAAAIELADHLSGYTVVAIKSTVPVGTGDEIEALIHLKNPEAQFDMVSLPEFLREGYAVYDFFHPDRLVIGTDSEVARNTIAKLYSSFGPETKRLFVNRRSSEAIKYASNAFLAVKIHYINEMANFCEKTGADVTEVAKGMGMDERIGNRFLNPGPGFGGSCFPKDTIALVTMAQKNGVKMSLIEATVEGNTKRKQQVAKRILEAPGSGDVHKIAVLGLAFKNGTDDCRESPSLEIINHLLDAGISIVAYDPKAMKVAKQIYGDRIEFASDMYAALKDADVLAILTEWDEFRDLDLHKAAQLMNKLNIVDCRNILNPSLARANGFSYSSIGRA